MWGVAKEGSELWPNKEELLHPPEKPREVLTSLAPQRKRAGEMLRGNRGRDVLEVVLWTF